MDDRRFAVFVCNNRRVGDRAYFNMLRASLTDFTAHVFFTYLMERPIHRRDFQKIPDTLARRAMMAYSTPPAISWINREVWSKVGQKGTFAPGKTGVLSYDPEDAYFLFSEWARKTGLYIAHYPMQQFLSDLENLVGVKKRRLSGATTVSSNNPTTTTTGFTLEFGTYDQLRNALISCNGWLEQEDQ